MKRRDVLGLGAWLLAGFAARPLQAAEPPIIYGMAVSLGEPVKDTPPQEIPNPDPAQVVDGRYTDKESRRALISISHENGRVIAQMQDLPPMEVVFGKRAPPRAPMVLIFTSDRTGHLVLSRFISGDVGGEFVPAA